MRAPIHAAAAALLLLGLACDPQGPETRPENADHRHGEAGHSHGEEAESWSVTAWGELYEIFPEADSLVAGEVSVSHTHVTVLDGFTPLVEGTVAVVLSGPRGEEVFERREPVRPGIYNVEIRPSQPGDYDLAFRIDSAAGRERIPGGRVRVGTAESPGGVIEGPSPGAFEVSGEPLDFLKEEQWRTRFATAPVGRGRLRRSLSGLARVRPAAGGEVQLTAPFDAVLLPEPWPFPGLEMARGGAVFRLAPRLSGGESLAALAAAARAAESELAPARERLRRLEELLELEAASLREVEEARARAAALEARSAAARRDHEAARAARQGTGRSPEAVAVTAPFRGRVATVEVTPGQAVAAGDPLGRLVKTRPVWLEVALRPEEATRLAGEGAAGVALAATAGGEAVAFGAGELRLVARAPEADPGTGTVGVLLEVSGAAAEELVLGSALGAEVLLPEEIEGVTVPASALVDDGGVPVVYLQLAGESFLRREVEVLLRQGGAALVEGLTPGERLVTRGGAAVRRSSLMAGGEVEGHVH